MRKLLIVNNQATRVNAKVIDGVRNELAGDGILDVAESNYRGHATKIAAAAREMGYEAVLSLGGDGTANEVINGLLEHGADGNTPLFAPLPAGGTNVFARTLGMPGEAVEAARSVAHKLDSGERRRISLGLLDGSRWFAFVVSLGLDAEIVRIAERIRFERRRDVPAPRNPGLNYLRLLRQHFFSETDRRDPALSVYSQDGRSAEGLFMVYVSNTAPWTYLGPRPVSPSPTASYDRGLDIFGLRSLSTPTVLRAVGRMMSTPPGASPRASQHFADINDAPGFVVESSRAIAVQADGDYLGERNRVALDCVPGALTVIA
jgi:diacylglycerol kinase family enzyme